MVKNQNGVTLIELLITIALIGMLAASTIQFGTAWVANNNISKVEKLFQNSMTKAKNEALRNPNGVIGSNTMAAEITIDASTHKILLKNSSNSIIWEDNIPSSVTITLSPTCSSIKLNNNGQNTSSCTDYSISSNGGTNATGKI